MKLEDRARRASEGIRRAVGAPEALEPSGPEAIERFHRYRERKQRTQRIGAGLVAAALVVAATVLVTQAFGRTHRTRPAALTAPNGLILYGQRLSSVPVAHWFTVRSDGPGVRDLHVVATCAQWFPNGSRILITDDAAVGPGRPLRPATINPDGSGLRRLDGTQDPSLNLGCGDASPDGTWLVLEGFNDSHPEVSGIYTVRASDGGGLVRLTRAPRGASDGYPQYSPNGKEVVFFRNGSGVSPNGAGALFVVNTDGTGLRQITPSGFAFLTQSWSPDGRWIVFERPYGELYLVHPDGSGLHRIPLQLPPGSGASNPTWSPDGTRIAFSLQRGSEANIFTVRTDSTGLQQVTHFTGVEEQNPDWARQTG